MEHHDYSIIVVTNFVPSFESFKFSSHQQCIVLMFILILYCMKSEIFHAVFFSFVLFLLIRTLIEML